MTTLIFFWTYPPVHKFEVATHITAFCNLVHTQFQLAIRAFQADNGKEFVTMPSSLFSLHGAFTYVSLVPTRRLKMARLNVFFAL